MLTLIDGHNLIPHVPGMSLSDPEDESQLIQVLQEYCRKRGRSVEVYFDRAPVGQAGEQRFGQVRAVFVREGVTADEAIMARLSGLERKARNAQVVSADRQVQQAARAVHAKVVPSQEFSAELQTLMTEEPSLDPRNRLLSDEELSAWEAFFRRGHPPKEG
jgi:predicted RNA-binding protein with PIN domain